MATPGKPKKPEYGIIRKDNGRIYLNRDQSWLSFNFRVLQEAADPNVPLFEKLKFLAIASSNLDEFFRVRIASLRSMINLKEKTLRKLHYDPKKLLSGLLRTIDLQQEEFGRIYEKIVLKGLNENNIFFLNETQLTPEQAVHVEEYFNDYVRPWLRPMIIIKKRVSPFLKNNALYLLIKLELKDIKKGMKNQALKKPKYANVEIPTEHLPRFFVLPRKGNKQSVMFLDDVIRFKLSELFPGYNVMEAYAVKLTRDADLYIDDEYSGNLVQKIRKSLQKRRTGVPARFL